MVGDLSQKVQYPYHFAIIDEIDSVLIVEAKSPLIVAGKMQSNTDLHMISTRLAKRFVADLDYDFDEETKATSPTDVAFEKIESAFGIENLYEPEHNLVDMFTGRIMEGSTLSNGLHQAIEAKEGL